MYGLVLGGWASNNKYAFLGGLRASAQMVSYEVALGLSLVTVLMMTGNVTLTEVVFQQQRLSLWFIFPLSLAFILFVISAFAETNRLPFDMPEAESELIAGYHTEYSAMKFSLFFIAEYANMVTVSAMMATLFFGGWDLPGRWDETGSGLATLITGLAMFLKTFFFLFFFMWIRWTLPRFRYDQLMALGWKFLIPLALAYIIVTTVLVWALESVVGISDPKVRSLVLFGVNAVLCYVIFFILDRGTLLSGSYRQPRTPANAGS